MPLAYTHVVIAQTTTTIVPAASLTLADGRQPAQPAGMPHDFPASPIGCSRASAGRGDPAYRARVLTKIRLRRRCHLQLARSRDTVRRSSGRLRAALVLMTALAALPGCGESDTDPSLVGIILSTPPNGYAAQSVSGGDGTLSIDAASTATPADPQSVRAFLHNGSWRGAVVRVWTRGEDYVEDVGFAFASADDAQRFARLEVDAVRASPSNYVYPVASIVHGQGFILYSQTRVGGRNVFCNGVWFPFRADAFELLTCGATPQDGQLATLLAASQLQHAGGSPAPATGS